MPLKVVYFTSQIWTISFRDLRLQKVWFIPVTDPWTMLPSDLPCLHNPEYFHEIGDQNLPPEHFPYFFQITFDFSSVATKPV